MLENGLVGALAYWLGDADTLSSEEGTNSRSLRTVGSSSPRFLPGSGPMSWGLHDVADTLGLITCIAMSVALHVWFAKKMEEGHEKARAAMEKAGEAAKESEVQPPRLTTYWTVGRGLNEQGGDDKASAAYKPLES